MPRYRACRLQRGRVDRRARRDLLCAEDPRWGGFGDSDPGGLPGEPTRIGFAGPVRWITSLTGRAELTITPGADFGGIDFAVVAGSSGARIAGVRLAPGTGYQLEARIAPDGTFARAMLLSMGAASGSATILVDLDPSLPSGGGGSLSLAGVRSATRLAQAMPTDVESASAPVPQTAAPGAPSVEAARPNPFGDETEIAYALPTATRATLRVYSASGRLVRTLVDSEMPAGVHRARWMEGTRRAGALAQGSTSCGFGGRRREDFPDHAPSLSISCRAGRASSGGRAPARRTSM